MTIHIQELTFETIIGILDFERKTPQRVIIDIELEYAFDDEFIDYALVVKSTKELMIKEQFLLIEDALLSIKEMIKKSYPQTKSLKIKVSKPDILSECRVALSNFWEF
jgi:dihydroneopterin aldolase